MRVSELLVEEFGRLPELVRGAVEGLSAEQLRWAPAPGANTVGWLVWHLTRVQDGHVAELIDGAEEVWVTGDWAARFGLRPDPDNTATGTPRSRSRRCGRTVRRRSSDTSRRCRRGRPSGSGR